jgi:hypothetical protein
VDIAGLLPRFSFRADRSKILLPSLTAEIENAAAYELRISFSCRITSALFAAPALIWEYVRGQAPSKITHYGVEPTFVLGVAGQEGHDSAAPKSGCCINSF